MKFNIFIFVLLQGFSCTSKVPTKPQVSVISALPCQINENCFYSFDSTYILNILDVEKLQIAEPVSFYIVSTINCDTIYVSKKEYNLVRWVNDSILLLRKNKGIPSTNAKTNLRQSSRPENYVDKYLNCNTFKFTDNWINQTSIKP
jgi:hypothetical protein